MTLHSIAKYKSQQGAAMLIFMLVLVTAASYTLITKLNAARKPYVRDLVTSKVLAEAKQALISYAVTYPERAGSADLTAGPGYMSCPDTNNNGSPNVPCGPNAEGRFPGEFWDVNDYLDSSGQRLWYAVSDNFRNIGTKFQPMNSDTPGQLIVDGVNDIVAVIIAPGEPVAGQDNRPSNNIADYLEGENANSDNVFTLNSGGNDILVYITRQELMSVIEKRVLGDVANTINNYQTAYNAFPWLSPFANPNTTASFRAPRDGTSDPIPTYQGYLPFHWAADTSVIANVNPFDTKVSWSWDIDTGTATVNIGASAIGVSTIGADCLEEVNCTTDAIFPTITSVITNWAPNESVDCTWTDRATVNCGANWILRGPVACDLGCGNEICYRAYRVTLPSFTGITTVTNPTSTQYRTRSVSYSGRLPGQNNAIRIADYYSGLNPSDGCSTTYVGNWHQFGSLSFIAPTAQGTIVAGDIQYDLDVDNNELPLWFVANDWQNLVYVAYSSGEPLPGNTVAGQDCVSIPATCLTINKNGTLINNVRASVLSAGVDLNAARPSGLLTDYFDNVENTNLDDTFLKNTTTNIYNDQTRVISTAP